jgi:hypothetical protein
MGKILVEGKVPVVMLEKRLGLRLKDDAGETRRILGSAS